MKDELGKKNVHIQVNKFRFDWFLNVVLIFVPMIQQQLEKREPEIESRIRQQVLLQAEILQSDIKQLQEQVTSTFPLENCFILILVLQLNDRDRLLNEIKKEKNDLQLQMKQEYEKLNSIHSQV